jgi:hypothetical protein
MKKHHVDQLDMLQGIEHIFNKNTGIWTSIVPLANAKNQLSTHLASINSHYAVALRNITGSAEDKKRFRLELEALAYDVSCRLTSYFQTQNNEELIESTFFSVSALRRMKGNELVGVCYHLHRLATSFLPSLAPFLITATSLSNLLLAIQTFSQRITTPAELRTHKREANQALKLQLKQCMNLMYDNLDKLIVMLQSAHPQFVAQYRLMRQITNRPSHRRSLDIACYDATTNLPLAGVKIAIVSEKLKRTSGKAGKSYVQHLPEGKHQISVSHPDYASRAIDVIIVAKQRTIISIPFLRNIESN